MARIAYSSMAVTITVITARCQWAGTGTAVAAMPTRAPSTVPRLKQPCRIGMVVLPVARSTSAASTLIATSPPPMPTPNMNSPAMTSGADARRLPALTTPTLVTIRENPTPITGLVPKRETSRPEHRIPIMDPSDSPNRITPISAVDASSRSRMSGVRATHDASETPGMRKNRNSALRRRRMARSNESP